MTQKAVLIFIILTGAAVMSDASQITLDPGLLPSSQGWAFQPSNLLEGTAETDLFSADGSVLNMNSMGQPIHWYSGGASVLYRQHGVVSSSMANRLEWTSRSIDYEYVPCTGQNHGFSIGFSDGSLRYGAGINLNNIALFDGSGIMNIATDTTAFHTYRIETVAGTPAYSFYIDDVLKATASARHITEANKLYFGDGTGGANAIVDVTALTFSQIPEPASLGLIALFTGGTLFVRRIFVS